jgi:hypothetical protein
MRGPDDSSHHDAEKDLQPHELRQVRYVSKKVKSAKIECVSIDMMYTKYMFKCARLEPPPTQPTILLFSRLHSYRPLPADQ